MKYWKQTRLLMQFSDDSSIVGYVMRGRPRIGARADNIGSWIFDGFTSTDPATGRNWFLIGEIASERWKTAPIITEWCGCQDTPENALRQVRDHHVVALGDNSAFTTNRDIGKALGFRFVLDSLTYPSTVVPGTTITIQSWWSNAGVTPAYEKWETRYEIYNGKGTLIFSTSGILDFETFLPGRKSVTDSVKLPSTVAGGACRFALTVADPSGYYTKPLSLAVKGIDSKGRYTLGDIIVQERTGARVAPGRTFIDNQDRVPKRSILLLRQCQYESVAAGRMFTLRGERISNRPGTIKGLLRTGVYFISAAAVLLRNPCHGKRGQFF